MEKVIKASLDRVEGDFAVIYADEASAAVAHNHHYRSDVPLELVKNAKPGTRLQLHIENDLINHIEIDREATEKARDRIRKKYERLQRARHLRGQ
jgi:DNA transposition AAA+ family ATPase